MQLYYVMLTPCSHHILQLKSLITSGAAPNASIRYMNIRNRHTKVVKQDAIFVKL